MAKWKDNNKRPSGRERAQQRQREAAEREAAQRDSADQEDASAVTPTPANAPKADWRSKGAAARTNARRDQNRPGWAHGETDPTAWKRAKSRLILFGMAVVLLSLIGAFIYYAFNLPTRTRMVVIVPSEGLGQDEFTSLPIGQQALPTFEEVQAGPNPSLVVSEGDANSLLKQEDLTGFAQKHDLYGGGPDRNVVTFYIAGMGVVDEQGAPYFVSLGDSPFNRGNWISLKTFFENLMRMKDVKDRELKKVLFIDSQRMEPLVDPRLMIDTFPSAVEALLGQVEFEDAGIHVVVSHETGQQSCYAPELGRSVFAHFLARGLAGEADGCLDVESKDDFISLNELSTYVRSQVATWVRNHRGVRQTPIVYPAISDASEPVQIILTKGNEGPRDELDPAVKGVKDRHTEVQAKWEGLTQQLSSHGISFAELYRLKPFAVARLESLMTRLEWLVPQQGSTEYMELKEEVARLLAEVFELRDFEPRRVPASLAESIARGQLPTARLSRDDGKGDLLTQWVDAHALEEEEKRTEAIEAIRLNLSDGKYTSVDEMRWLMWTWLRKQADGPSQQQLEEAIGIIDDYYAKETRSRPRTEWIEIKFLQMLHRYIDWEATDPAKISRAIGVALACREKAETVLAQFDPRARYWVESSWQELEQKRRLAEDQLYASEFDVAIEAFTAMPAEYDSLARQCQQMAGKLDLHQDALHALPYLAAWEFRRRSVMIDQFYEPDGTLSRDPTVKANLDRFRQTIQDLHQISQLTDELGKELYLSLDQARPEDIGRIETGELQRLLAAAKGRYDESCRSLVDDSREASNSALIEITHALMCPLADLGRRAELRDRYTRILERYSAGGAGGKVDPRPLVSWQPSMVRDYNVWVDDLYPKLASQPFFRAESRVRNRMEDVLERLDRKRWATNGVTDSYTLFEQLQADWTDQESDRDRFVQRDHLFGVNHFLMKFLPYMVASRSAIKIERSEVRAVGEELFEAHHDLFELSLAERALNDFWGNENDYNSRQSYFVRLARLHLDAMTTSEDQKQRVESLLNEREQLATALRNDVNEFLSPKQDVPYSDQPDSTFPHEVLITYKSGLPAGIASMNLARRNNLNQLYPTEDENDKTIRKRPVEVDPNPMRQQFNYDVPKIGPFLKREEFAVLLNYRGHESMRTFYALLPDTGDPEDMIRLQFDPVHRQQATVQVVGGQKATSDVLIIVDCSLSMDEMVEGPDGRSVKRMEMALTMAQSLVRRLEEEGNFRVALGAFGHRVNFKSQRDLSYNWSKRGKQFEEDWVQKNVRPANDVEIIFGFSERRDFRETDPERYVEIQNFLVDRELQSWGLTPLYEALVRGTEHLRRLGNPEAERHLIVITDGVNSVYEPKGLSVTQIGDISELNKDNDVIKLKESEIGGARIHMVLYDVKASSGVTEEQIRSGKKHLKQISRLSGVEEEVIDSSDASLVLERIDDFIVPNRFTITAPGATDPNGTTSLGNVWQAPIVEPGPHRLDVTIRGIQPKTLYLYGGENLYLELLRNNEFSIRRTPDKVLTDMEVRSLSNRDYQIGMIDVNRPGSMQAFKVGMQAANFANEHSDRPAFAALDVQAVSSVTSGGSFYRLYDFDFELETSYPIVNFPSIPVDQAATYELRFRAVPRGSQPRSYILRKSVKELPGDDAPFPVNAGTTKMKVSRKGSEVNVIVDSEQAKGVHDLAVVCTDAVSIRRVYSPDGDHAEYKFVLKDLDLEKPNNEAPQLEVYAMDELFNADNGVVEVRFKYP